MYYIYVVSVIIPAFYFVLISNPINSSIFETLHYKEPFAAFLSVSIIGLVVILIVTFVPVINTIATLAIISLFLNNKLRLIQYTRETK